MTSNCQYDLINVTLTPNDNDFNYSKIYLGTIKYDDFLALVTARLLTLSLTAK